jgi:hypothetical protein
MSRRKIVTLGLVVPVGLALAACSSSPSGSPQSQSPTSSVSSNSGGGTEQIELVRSCEADWRVLEVAIDAYDATVGSDPVPPAPWSQSTYISNFAPLTSSHVKGGPYLHNAYDPANYVIEYDGQGNVWIEPAGTYDTNFNPKQAASDKVCESILQ